MSQQPDYQKMIHGGELLVWAMRVSREMLDAVCCEAEAKPRTGSLCDAATSELAARITVDAMGPGYAQLYKVFAELLNLRSANTGQHWFYDAAAGELGYHILTDCPTLCHSCGLRQVAGSGQLWCAVCASRV